MLSALNLRRSNPDSGKVLLDCPSLEIAPGERVAIQGPSGSGKTLLLRALAWLDRLDGGEVRYRGRPVHQDAVPAFRQRVRYCHQAPSLEGVKVEDVLKAPFRLRAHRHARYDRAAAAGILGSLGRDESFLDKVVRDLSGGERQIAALVRGLLLEPEVLLLDEPTAALDRDAADKVERLARGWVDERRDGRALLWVSHDPDQAGRIATRTVAVDAGRVTS
ncbi:MAG: ABC transporter ATP-binding protein [Thermoguttaceae bacterium]